MKRSLRGKKAMSDEDKIEKQLESLREGCNDQRIFDALVYTVSVKVIDETHTPLRGQ